MGGATPRITDDNVIAESRKYLGAAYVFVGREEDAERQFELIVRADQSERMQANEFTAHVVEIFDRVRTRVRRQIEQQQEEEAERERRRRQQQIEAMRASTERMQRLIELAEQSEIRVENSRWLATIPFGVGQFQNGDQGLGIYFATSSGILAVGSILSAVVHATLDPANYIADDEAVRRAAFESDEQAWRVTNWVTTGALLLNAIVGVIEAQANFVPYRARTEHRELPDDLVAPPEGPAIEAEVGLSPFGASMRLRF